MILILPDPDVPDLSIVLDSPNGRDDISSARNMAETIRAQCGPSELTRLLDRLANHAERLERDFEWLQAKPK